jgi:hypothetical protein
MKSVFLGSVSDKCVHECPCPVLVVRNATIWTIRPLSFIF